MYGNISARLETNYALSTALCYDQQYYIIKSLLYFTIYPTLKSPHGMMLHMALVEAARLKVDTSLCTLHQVLGEYSSGPARSVERQTTGA